VGRRGRAAFETRRGHKAKQIGAVAVVIEEANGVRREVGDVIGTASTASSVKRSSTASNRPSLSPTSPHAFANIVTPLAELAARRAPDWITATLETALDV
jgi:hypothetical protein